MAGHDGDIRTANVFLLQLQHDLLRHGSCADADKDDGGSQHQGNNDKNHTKLLLKRIPKDKPSKNHKSPPSEQHPTNQTF